LVGFYSKIFDRDIKYENKTIYIDSEYPKNVEQADKEKYKINSNKYSEAKQSTAEIMIDGKKYEPSNPVLLVNGSTYLSLRELANIFNEPIEFAGGIIYIKDELDKDLEEEIVENKKPEFTVLNELILKPNGELWVYGDNEGGRLSPTIKVKHITQPVKLFDDVRQILESGSDRGNNFEDFPAYLIVKEDNTLWRLGLKQEKLMDGVAKINDNVIITTDGELYLHGFKSGLLTNEILPLLGSSNDEFMAWDTWDEPYKIETIKVKGVSNVKDAMYVSAIEPNSSGTGISNEAESLLILKNDNSLWGCTKYTTTVSGKIKGHLNSIEHIMGNVKELVNAGNVNAVIKQDNSLWAWGETSYGAFGGNYIAIDKDTIGSFGTANVRKNIGYYKFHSAEPMKGAVDVQVNSYPNIRTYALKEDGSVWVWGDKFIIEKNEDMELEEGTNTRIPRPFIR